MQFDDDLMIGPVVAGGPIYPQVFQAANRALGSSPMTRGIGPLGRSLVYHLTPAALATANIAALQTTAGAGSLTLTAGAGVTRVVDGNGVARYQLDVPRCISFTSAANISAVNFTVSGYDLYGQPMTQTLAGPNANTVNTTKAFYQVTSVAVSAAVGTNTSVGTSDIFGMPVLVSDLAFIERVGWNNTLAANAATAVKGDATSPATAATGDVRGTVSQAGAASDGAKTLVVVIGLPGTAVGPQATRAGALGVTQV